MTPPSALALLPSHISSQSISTREIVLPEGRLVDELPGYVEYMNKVQYRLVPLVW